MSTIYNSTDGPLIIDRAGRVLGARERLEDVDVDASPISGHLAAGRLVLVDDGSGDVDAAEPVAELASSDDDAETSSTTGTRKGRRSSTTTTTQEG